MALPTTTVLESSIADLWNALTTYKDKTINQRAAAAALQSVINGIRQVYKEAVSVTIGDTDDADLQAALAYPQFSMTVTDATDADLAAFFAITGELGVALTRAAAVGDTFKVLGVGDTTDNALQAAKGGAVAANDVFIVSNVTPASEAVVYAGNDNEVGDAFGRRVRVGDVFKVAGTGDTTDNALQAAKDASLLATLDITITDLADADIATCLASGEVATALGRAARAGEVIQVGGAGDTTANDFAAAKGSAPADGDKFIVNATADDVTYFNPAPAANDLFVVSNVTIGSEAVLHIGDAISVATMEVDDFVSIGA